MPNLRINENMRQFFVDKLTDSLTNPSGDWRDYQEAVDRWHYLNTVARSNNPIIRLEEVPPHPDVDDYPLIS